jgi:hypothetical protein
MARREPNDAFGVVLESGVIFLVMLQEQPSQVICRE